MHTTLHTYSNKSSHVHCCECTVQRMLSHCQSPLGGQTRADHTLHQMEEALGNGPAIGSNSIQSQKPNK